MNDKDALNDQDNLDINSLLAQPELADALDSERFRCFLDQVPIAIVVSMMQPYERIVYANAEFERLFGQREAEFVGKKWDALRGEPDDPGSNRGLGAAIQESSDCVGAFRIAREGQDDAIVDAHSNIIEDNDGVPAFRLAALINATQLTADERQNLEQKIREKDVLLREIQHRVKNNLQLITALIRLETRNAGGRIDTEPFSRLAGRIESVQLVYKLLSVHGKEDEIDLGVYLSEIVTGVMRAHAVEGVRLDLKVDAYPVSVNVALPIGLVVNELLTNSLKYAFVGRKEGTITLRSVADGTGCRVLVADDGVGLPVGTTWPSRGKMGALIVQSLRENAKATLTVASSPGKGTLVTMAFTRAASAPEASKSDNITRADAHVPSRLNEPQQQPPRS
jgi:PAS domain S-box-containing protein